MSTQLKDDINFETDLFSAANQLHERICSSRLQKLCITSNFYELPILTI
ncbi:hypothetical protein IGA_06327 [Bacillus cereus HuA3-9]|uniref:Uncharacterized protein n=1 Tax=Bacillus cereus HuA3-9 TaxID=1053205 RepID=R8CAX5_BACCE|nr:hypothetical protein IGA_06327 [Bacillus cereus HuA3-9]